MMSTHLKSIHTDQAIRLTEKAMTVHTWISQLSNFKIVIDFHIVC
ncbi:unnamed protein product [Tenebrio molitor]|nr:unnamed protein product [Tenebrio molitor]